VGCIVLDEIHHARNKETQLYSKLLELSRKSTYKLGLSATPIHNSLDDLISIFSILFPIVEVKVWEYVLREIWAKKSVQILHPFITKFDKQELGIHFTKRNIHQIEIDLPASFHRLVESSIEKKGVSKGTMLTAFEKSIFYRLSTSSPRAFFNSLGRNTPEDYRDHKIEILHDLILGQPSCRWVIFTEFTETAELIKDTLIVRSPHIISGDSSFAERYLAIDDFRKNPEGVLIMMPVGCEGLDLQICSKLINYDLHWNPMVIEQRIGRIDRIGQAKKSIDVYNFVITGSIDHHMLSIMNEKLGIVSDTFAGIEPIINKEESMAKNAEDIFFDSVDLSKFNLLNEIAASLPKLDYDLQNLLTPELCNTKKWPRKIENWDGPKGLIKSIEAHKILSEVRQNSFEIYNILSDYS
jgi:SNF2 family DNA or RNA helicase